MKRKKRNDESMDRLAIVWSNFEKCGTIEKLHAELMTSLKFKLSL